VSIDPGSKKNLSLDSTYRFKSRQQLQQLKDGLQIPEWLVNPADRCRYNGEEVLLIVLERCALGTRLFDLQMKYHRNHASIGKAITFFCSWLQQRWGYLIHDHLEFWKPYLRESSDAIAIKLREYYDDEDRDLNDFKVTGFIDWRRAHGRWAWCSPFSGSCAESIL
jgi:hypothetical protein